MKVTEKHVHKWTKPHYLNGVGWIKACEAPYCYDPIRAVRQPKECAK